MSASHEDTLRQFCEFTGADEARSRFFLESSNWQLEVALSSFYENGGNSEEAPANPAQPGPIHLLSDSDMDSPPGSPQAPVKKEKAKPKRSNQNFATLSTLQQDESSSDEEEGQAFYAGGSDRSGQQIIGPGKAKKDIVNEMFKSVRERGAVVFDDEPSSTSRGGGTFSGTGYRLGQTPDDHEAVTPEGAQAQEARSVRLRLYREGFTVDGGELRHYTDPEHAEFLNCIRRGEVPTSLGRAGGEVRVSLEDRRLEGAPPPGARGAFQGPGQLLGSPTPAVIGAPAPADGADRAACERAAQQQLSVDDKEPTTTLQIRLADGSRLTARFNHSHTVAQLREYITTAAPVYQLASFVLMTTFPSAELSDPSVTLKQANLLNSVVVQRLK